MWVFRRGRPLLLLVMFRGRSFIVLSVTEVVVL